MRIPISFRTAIFLLLFAGCAEKGPVDENRRFKVQPLDLADVTLLEGPFKHAMELNKTSLLSYDPDRLLSKFRIEAGLKPKAQAYGGWEAMTLAGHSLGHHLSGCSHMFRSTGDERFLNRVKTMVDELKVCQEAGGGGYLGAVPGARRVFEEEVARGDIRPQRFDLNGIWSPFYTYHKIMAGLRDAYRLCGIQNALILEENFAGWVSSIVQDLDDRHIQTMLDCEHGGMNEVLADLHADTGKEEYLRLARVFHHRAVLDSLAAGIDVLPDLHANTQIPKAVGEARLYELTGDRWDKKAALFFWETVTRHHSYATGGNGNHEYFGPPGKLRNRLSDETTETCNVYNMLKLTQHVFLWDADAEAADFYERALFNHILASQHPLTGRVIYNLSLEMGGYKEYQDPLWFTCCVGTGMENHSKYGGAVFYKNDQAFYVTQFIAAEAVWKEKEVTVIQNTKFPEEQGTSIEIRTAEPKKFDLMIRYPSWAARGMTVRVNGKHLRTGGKPGSFVSIRRVWKSGDQVEVRFPFSLRLESMPDDQNRAAILYGPLVLAGDLGPVEDPDAEKEDYVPALFTGDRDPVRWLHPVEGAANCFRTDESAARPRSFTLKPFYATHDRRYSVYWDLYNQARWEQHQKEMEQERARLQDLEARTLDLFLPGDQESERIHAFQGEKAQFMVFQHKKARVADRGGWMGLEMKADPSSAALVVRYWGGFTGSRTFDIVVEGQVLATENIAGKKDGSFVDVQYDIPAEWIKRKNHMRVEFRPHTGNRAGPVFEVRSVRR